MSGYSMLNGMKAQLALNRSHGSDAGTVLAPAFRLTGQSTQFLKDYQAEMNGMLSAANGVLNPKRQTDRLTASSNNLDIATVSGNLERLTDNYLLKVEQTASEQVNRSKEMASGASLPAISGKLNIQTVDRKVELFLRSAGAGTNKEAFENFAAVINAQNAGITASVLEKNGYVALEISGQAGGDFTLSGSFAEQLGLDKIADESRQAVFSLSKNGQATESFTSSSNRVEIDGISATLTGVGTTRIDFAPAATDTLTNAMQQLTDRFNSALSFLNKNEDQGIGVLNQIKRMITPPVSESSMAKAGITVKSDGSLNFDRAAFVLAMEKNPSLISSISKNIAQGISSDAQLGMRESSKSLVPQSISLQPEQRYNIDTLHLLNLYSHRGVYNMLNLNAVGVLMNINI